MNRDKFIRRVLWVSVIFNLGGAFLFAFPASPIGQFAGLPVSVPLIYRMLLAFFVVLFGGAYAWLARQQNIDQPLVALAAIGKAGVFAIIFIFWLMGEAAGRAVLIATGDLIFAGLYTWWLLGVRQDARPQPPERVSSVS